MLSAAIAVIVLMATTLQAWSAAVELGRANRDVVDWWDAEDQPWVALMAAAGASLVDQLV